MTEALLELLQLSTPRFLLVCATKAQHLDRQRVVLADAAQQGDGGILARARQVL